LFCKLFRYGYLDQQIELRGIPAEAQMDRHDDCSALRGHSILVLGSQMCNFYWVARMVTHQSQTRAQFFRGTQVFSLPNIELHTRPARTDYT
jgi:hypothetical protein